MIEKENYFELVELSNEIFKSTYQYDNETIDQLWLRVGSHLASVEKEKEYLDLTIRRKESDISEKKF